MMHRYKSFLNQSDANTKDDHEKLSQPSKLINQESFGAATMQTSSPFASYRQRNNEMPHSSSMPSLILKNLPTTPPVFNPGTSTTTKTPQKRMGLGQRWQRE